MGEPGHTLGRGSASASAPSNRPARRPLAAARPGTAPAPPDKRKSAGHRSAVGGLKLRHLLFFLLVGTGIIPLVVSSTLLIGENQDILKTQEKVLLTQRAQALAETLSVDLARRNEQLRQLGTGVVAAPGYETLEDRLREPWVGEYLRRFAAERQEILAFRLLDQRGIGLQFESGTLAGRVETAMGEARQQALNDRAPVYRFVTLGEQETAAIVVVPVAVPDSSEVLVVQALVRTPIRLLAATAGDELFLIDRGGSLLWSTGTSPEVERALLDSQLVTGYARMPLSVIGEYDLPVRGRTVPILAQLVPVQESGWAVVVHKLSSRAFENVDSMVFNTVLVSLLLVLVSLVFALLAAHWFGKPIQQLAKTTHEIANGHFDRRVETAGLGFELADLAVDFNRMSEYVAAYVARLQRAARLNRELFISSIRAFAAAIDAKDPYTRGHSERVAAYARAIARSLGLPREVQERVWISAVLHDVGKIGVDDKVLKKRGMLAPEEFEQMKLHPVIGADIVEPISALREMIPGIRWHHEAWNGSGYPDGLRGEQIPLQARIIGVADTFDAITTNRPYQEASPPDRAIEIIRKLTGAKFDAKIVSAFLRAWEAGLIKFEPLQPAETLREDMNAAVRSGSLVAN